ncbi:MAG: hypothetical protein H6834_11835 [Planctomycetes bacterium]|nr:hypothetical protein [Planctomycetota bacterium]
MGVLKKLLHARGLAAKRRQVAADGTPRAYADLARSYAAMCDYDSVARITEEGLQRFPEAHELHRLWRTARSAVLSDRISALREELNTAPRPAVYRELTETYLEMDDIPRCEAVCVQWSARFPGDDGASLALARARIRRFYKERNAVDGLGAVDLLRGICERDSQNAKAMRLLAELSSRVGAYAFARDVLAQLLELIPGEPALEGWYRRVADDAEGAPGLTSAIRDVELSGSFTGVSGWSNPEQQPDEPASGPVQSQRLSLREELDNLASREGIGRVAYLRGSTALVRGAHKGDGESFARMLRALNTVARRSTRRMGLGSFSGGILENEEGRVILASAGESAIAAESSLAFNQTEVLDVLGNLVSSTVGAGGEDA